MVVTLVAGKAAEPDYSFNIPFAKQALNLKLPFTCTATKFESISFGGPLGENDERVEILSAKQNPPFILRVSLFGGKADITGATLYGILKGVNDGGGGHYWFNVINNNGYILILQNNDYGFFIQLSIDLKRGAFVLTTTICDDNIFVVRSTSGIAKND